jgi:hypothetical protein
MLLPILSRHSVPEPQHLIPLKRLFLVSQAYFRSRAATPEIVLGRTTLLGLQTVKRAYVFWASNRYNLIPVVGQKNLYSFLFACAAYFPPPANPASPFLLRVRRQGQLPLPPLFPTACHTLLAPPAIGARQETDAGC